MSQISAWEQHRRDQEDHLFQREFQRAQRAEANREYEAELRRRCAVQPYRSPLNEKAATIRERVAKLFSSD
jgi:hypothetical protein